MDASRFYVIFFLASYSFVSGQTLQGIEAQTNVQMLGGAGFTARTFDDRYEGVKGYPTLLEKYSPARIRSVEGKIVFSNSCNLDVYTNDLIVLRNKQELVLSKSVISSFVIFDGQDSLYFVKQEVNDQGIKYYQRLVKGEVELLKLHTKTFVKADYQGAYSSGRTQDEFRNGKKYFLKLSEEKVEEIKTKKDIQKALPQYQQWLDAFIKENKLDMKEEQHLISLIENLNAAHAPSVN